LVSPPVVALAFRARLLRRGADDVGIKKMSDAKKKSQTTRREGEKKKEQFRLSETYL